MSYLFVVSCAGASEYRLALWRLRKAGGNKAQVSYCKRYIRNIPHMHCLVQSYNHRRDKTLVYPRGCRASRDLQRWFVQRHAEPVYDGLAYAGFLYEKNHRVNSQQHHLLGFNFWVWGDAPFLINPEIRNATGTGVLEPWSLRTLFEPVLLGFQSG